MLEKIYGNKTESELKFVLKIYTALLIVSLLLPILFNLIFFYINGKTNFKVSIVFILIFIWSLLNVDYLKKRKKN